MTEQVRSFVLEKGLLCKNDGVVMGVSGGADSVCLFFMLLSMKEEFGLSLAAVHVNHGLRGAEADEDEAFVKELCAANGVPFFSVKRNVAGLSGQEGLSLEEAGRRARYEAFEEIRQKLGYEKVAVAHNRNDQSETVLFNLFRGSALKGLAGMAPLSGRIIRPLLFVSRKEIEAYLSERGISFRTDRSNFSEAYTRNKIRLRLLPYVSREINAEAEAHIAKTAGMVREAEEYIEKNAILAFRRMTRQKNGKYLIDAQEFGKEAPVIQKRVLLLTLERLAGGRKDLRSEHIGILMGLMEKQAGKQGMLPGGILAVRDYEGLVLSRGSGGSSGEEGFSPIPLSVPGEASLPGTAFAVRTSLFQGSCLQIADKLKNDYTKWFDYDKINNTVFWRTAGEEDFLQIDRAGHKKKLTRYFIDRKIPKEERKRIPLLADGRHIMWVVGGRISEAYRVDEHTRHILKVQLVEEENADGR